MKLHAEIVESVTLKVENEPSPIIVQFVEDKEKQHFEVMCYDFDAYRHGIRKWDIWQMNVNWKSDIFVDQKTFNKSYFTYFFCTKANPVIQMQK